MDMQRIHRWAQLRYDYYLAGRTLLFNNQMQAGVLMLGYAVEAHFKNLLSYDKNTKKKMQYGHDFLGSFKHLKSKGYLQEIEISDDLLHFVEDNFDRRYPSQTDRVLKKSFERGHALVMSPRMILNYDELILQLDMSLTRTIGTPEASLLMLGAWNVDNGGAKYFFHNNYSALSRIDKALQMCEGKLDLIKAQEGDAIFRLNLESHQERLKYFQNVDDLLKSNEINMFFTPKGGVEEVLRSVENFTYPGKITENKNGTVIISATF